MTGPMSSAAAYRPSAVWAAMASWCWPVGAQRAAAEVGDHRAGDDDVGRHPAWTKLCRHVPGEHLDGALDRPVGGALREGHAREAAGEVDDGSAVRQQGQQLDDRNWEES